jgi:hypothetical protein
MRTKPESEAEMTGAALATLIEAAKKVRPSGAQQEEQRRSFAYGNTAFENPLITRAMVDEQAQKLAASDKAAPSKR